MENIAVTCVKIIHLCNFGLKKLDKTLNGKTKIRTEYTHVRKVTFEKKTTKN